VTRLGVLDLEKVKIYRNEEVTEIIAAIPRGHYHVRLAIVLNDQVIVLQEATVAAIVRAYSFVAIHPTRKGVILRCKKLEKHEKKHGFAQYQLIEEPDSEEEAINMIEKLLVVSNSGENKVRESR